MIDDDGEVGIAGGVEEERAGDRVCCVLRGDGDGGARKRRIGKA